jgi:hypothetical protein
MATFLFFFQEIHHHERHKNGSSLIHLGENQLVKKNYFMPYQNYN